MINIRAKMFNRRASNQKFMPDKVIESLQIRPGEKVADIGSGGGYYSFQFSHLVKNEGTVFAVDTNVKLLNYIKNQGIEQGLDNLITVPTDGFPTGLPLGQLHLVFLRNVYHHLTERVEYFKRMKAYLMPEGRIAILDYSQTGGLSFYKPFDHKIHPNIIRKEMDHAGYKLDATFDFLPKQSFMVFRI